MKRRDFLKTCGIVLSGLAVPSTCLTSRPRFDKEILDIIKALPNYAPAVQYGMIPPGSAVLVGNQLGYVVLMHPKQAAALKTMAARDKYKHAQWVKRYDRWRDKQGLSPHQESHGEVGVFDTGVNWI